jgi:hypothetical protein
MPRKEQTNLRLTPVARDLLARLSDDEGISQGDIIEVLVRAEANRRGITVRPQGMSNEATAV